MPYTRESIAALRHAERTCTTAAEIQQLLGWDDSTLARRCAKHEIDLIGDASLSLPAAPAKLDPALEAIVSRLTDRQAQIFRVLQPHADTGQWFSSATIGRMAGNSAKANSLRSSMEGLARRLDRMDAKYLMENKIGPGGGYRLVIDKDAR